MWCESASLRVAWDCGSVGNWGGQTGVNEGHCESSYRGNRGWLTFDSANDWIGFSTNKTSIWCLNFNAVRSLNWNFRSC